MQSPRVRGAHGHCPRPLSIATVHDHCPLFPPVAPMAGGGRGAESSVTMREDWNLRVDLRHFPDISHQG